MSRYLANRVAAFKFLIVLVVTFGPPVGLVMSAEEAAIARHVDRRLEESERRGTPIAGDVVAVSGVVRADPIAAFADVPAFRRALMVVERHEVYRRSGRRHRAWRTTHVEAWVADHVMIGGWRLAPRLIQTAGFTWFRASPCTDYKPAPGWVADCPGNLYAVRAGDENARISYEVTPVSDRAVTLIAAVSETPGVLAAIDYDVVDQVRPVSILVWDVQNPHQVLADRLTWELAIMLLWWVLVVCVAAGWMHRGLSRGHAHLSNHLVVASLWRAVLVGMPFGSLLLGFYVHPVTPIGLFAGIAAISIGWLFWRRAGYLPPDDQNPQRSATVRRR